MVQDVNAKSSSQACFFNIWDETFQEMNLLDVSSFISLEHLLPPLICSGVPFCLLTWVHIHDFIVSSFPIDVADDHAYWSFSLDFSALDAQDTTV